MTVRLRDYQEKAITDVQQAFRSGKRAPIIVAPTGSGKTTIGSEIIARTIIKGNRVSWLVHRRELVQQASDRLKQFGVDHGIIMAGKPREPWKPVQVCSVQTLLRRQHANKANLYFIDEAHRALGESYIEILSRNPEAKLIGLTATPVRTDGRGLGHLFDSIIGCSTPQELTDRGFLVPARVFAPSAPDLTGVHKQAGDYKAKELEERVDKATLIGDIVDHWRRLAYGRRTVCFAVTVQHSKHIVERFLAAGIPAEHLDGETPLAEREAILHRITTGETLIVSNVGVWTEGVDVPAMSCALLARPTQSMGLYLQMGGRVLRPYEGKDEAVILDHAGCTLQHGFVTDEREWSLDGDMKKKKDSSGDGPAAPGVRVCKECFAAFPNTVSACPSCGAPYVVERQVEECAGELQEIRPGAYQLPRELSKNKKIAEIQKIAAMMGYSRRWVSRQSYRIHQGLDPEIPERVWAVKNLLESHEVPTSAAEAV